MQFTTQSLSSNYLKSYYLFSVRPQYKELSTFMPNFNNTYLIWHMFMQDKKVLK